MFTVRGLKIPCARVTWQYNNSYPTDVASPYFGPKGRHTLVSKTFLLIRRTSLASVGVNKLRGASDALGRRAVQNRLPNPPEVKAHFPRAAGNADCATVKPSPISTVSTARLNARLRACSTWRRGRRRRRRGTRGRAWALHPPGSGTCGVREAVPLWRARHRRSPCACHESMVC